MKKEGRPRSAFFHTFSELNSGYLTGTKATRTNRYGFGCTVNNCSYLTDIGLPSSVGLTMGMGYCLSENNALSTDAALCHIDTSSDTHYMHMFQSNFIERYILYHNKNKNAIVF